MTPHACRLDGPVDAIAPPPDISAGSTWLRQRTSSVTALAWTAPVQAAHPWLAAAHAGGEVDIFTYDLHELRPAATIGFRHPSAALALAWNPWRPHVLVTGASDQTVRGWNVALPKYAHPGAETPLLPAPDDDAAAAATTAGDEPDAAGNQASDEQIEASAVPLTTSAVAAAAAAAAAVAASASSALAEPAADQAEAGGGGTTSTVPGGPVATDMRSAQAVIDTQAAAELQDSAPVLQYTALPPDLSATDTGALDGAGIAKASTRQQDSAQPSDTAAAAGERQLPAQSAADMSEEQPDTVESMVSRPVDLAEVAAIRRGNTAPPAKSTMRSAASLGIGSLVGRLRRETEPNDTEVANDNSAPSDGSVASKPAGGIVGKVADIVQTNGGDDAPERTEARDSESAAEQGREHAEHYINAAEASTSAAADDGAVNVAAAEILPRGGARPTPGAASLMHPVSPVAKHSCAVFSLAKCMRRSIMPASVCITGDQHAWSCCIVACLGAVATRLMLHRCDRRASAREASQAKGPQPGHRLAAPRPIAAAGSQRAGDRRLRTCSILRTA